MVGLGREFWETHFAERGECYGGAERQSCGEPQHSKRDSRLGENASAVAVHAMADKSKARQRCCARLGPPYAFLRNEPTGRGVWGLFATFMGVFLPEYEGFEALPAHITSKAAASGDPAYNRPSLAHGWAPNSALRRSAATSLVASGTLALPAEWDYGWKDSGCNAGGETVEGTTLWRPQVAGVALIFG